LSSRTLNAPSSVCNGRSPDESATGAATNRKHPVCWISSNPPRARLHQFPSKVHQNRCDSSVRVPCRGWTVDLEERLSKEQKKLDPPLFHSLRSIGNDPKEAIEGALETAKRLWSDIFILTA
jgi:hypothetical protein